MPPTRPAPASRPTLPVSTPFDLVLTNPPFADPGSRGRTPHKLWIDFTMMMWRRLLATGGTLCQVSPASFQSPNSRVLDLMREHSTGWITFDVAEHFPGVGSSFSAYAITKTPHVGATTLMIRDGEAADVMLDDQVLWLPTDGPAGLRIHRAVMFSPAPKIGVEWDYVTCHNIRLHDPIDTRTLSRERTTRHVHPLFHTNAQTWWSSIRQSWADEPKVMWTRSGYQKPFFDPGGAAGFGGTDMTYFVRVAGATEGRILVANLESDLIRYVLATAKWSGFGNERVFAALPDLPRDRVLSADEMYARFGISASDRAHVETVLARRPGRATPTLPFPFAPPGTGISTGHLSSDLAAEIIRRTDEHGYMAGIERTVERVRATGEVFTATPLVVEMIGRLPISALAPGRRILDPACGDGQFLTSAKWAKVICFGMSEADACADLYGVDIMRDNADLCARRLGGGTILMGDTLDPLAPLPDQSAAEHAAMARLFG